MKPSLARGNPFVPSAKRCRLAARASSVAGVDLWADPILMERIFLSDRLKTAIDAAKIKAKGFDFIAARVVP